MDHSNEKHQTRRRVRNAAFGTIVIATTAGCNLLLGNEERDLEGLDVPSSDGASRRDTSEPPLDPPLDSSAGDAGVDADADADVACPAPVCASSSDCASDEICLGLSDEDGGVATRLCSAACDASPQCSAARQCVSASSSAPSRCAPPPALCGKTCTYVCGTTCVNILTDRRNCGTCGQSCGATKTCKGGSCS